MIFRFKAPFVKRWLDYCGWASVIAQVHKILDVTSRATACNICQHCWAEHCWQILRGVGGSVQTIPTMCGARAWIQHCWASLSNARNIIGMCASVTTKQKKCWLGLVGSKIWRISNLAQQHPTTRNNIQQDVQSDTTCRSQNFWMLLAKKVANVCTQGRSQDFSKGGGGLHWVKQYRYGVFTTEYCRLFA